MTTVDLTRMELQGNAPVGAASELKPGQAVGIRVDGIPGRTFEGKVVRINPVADEGTRTIRAYSIIDNSDGVLLGGMFATGSVVVGEIDEALAVSTVALREDADGNHLLRIADGRLLRTPVETGGTWAGGLTQITGGLAAGETIVAAPLPELQDGDAVKIVEE
jgi:RND family efflux transporter MFP subunit